MIDLLKIDLLRTALARRAVWLAAVAMQLGLATAAWSEDPSAASRAIADKMPLFARNHCETHRNPANQLFCADPDLIAAGAALASAIQERLSRLPDRLPAIEDNAQWIKGRNLSCGIFGNDPVRPENLEPVVACLKRETIERTAILRDPNFDCLAANSAAGTLICSDPELSEAEGELNALVRGLIGKLKGDEADRKSVV